MKPLFILVNPADRPFPGSDDFWEQFVDTLGSHTIGANIEPDRLAEPTWTALANALARGEWNILHFLTTAEKRDGSSTALALLGSGNRNRFFATELVAQELISESAAVKLVILQAMGNRGQSCVTIPQEFVDSGVSAAICAPTFHGPTQRHFLTCLYSALARGMSLDQLENEIHRAAQKPGDEAIAKICVYGKDSERPLFPPNQTLIQDRVEESKKNKNAIIFPSKAEEFERTKVPEPPVADGETPEKIQRLLQEKRSRGEHDLFLCHASKDKDFVKQIGNELKKQGFLPWLDDWDIEGGENWQHAISGAIHRCKAAIVFVGAQKIRGWQDHELSAILDESVKRNISVIPVILAEAPEDHAVPEFLRFRQWIDFRKQDPPPLRSLIIAVSRALSANPGGLPT